MRWRDASAGACRGSTFQRAMPGVCLRVDDRGRRACCPQEGPRPSLIPPACSVPVAPERLLPPSCRPPPLPAHGGVSASFERKNGVRAVHHGAASSTTARAHARPPSIAKKVEMVEVAEKATPKRQVEEEGQPRQVSSPDGEPRQLCRRAACGAGVRSHVAARRRR